jgi:hypothetical protein
MPDFNTRTRQEPDDQNGPRSLLIVSKVRDLLIAMRLRTLLIGGGIRGILLFVVVALPVGLLILSPKTVTCEANVPSQVEFYCSAPDETEFDETEFVVCKADSRDEVYDGTPCMTPPSSDPLVCTGNYCFGPASISYTWESCRSFQQANGGPECRQTGFLSFLVRKLAFGIWLLYPPFFTQLNIREIPGSTL